MSRPTYDYNSNAAMSNHVMSEWEFGEVMAATIHQKLDLVEQREVERLADTQRTQ
jgi:hypothetical protein